MRCSRRLRRLACGGLAVALASTLAPTRPAAADPVTDEANRAKELVRQIDQLGRQDSRLAERYDAAVLAQERAAAAVGPAQRALDDATHRSADSNAQLRQLAVNEYERGGFTAPSASAEPGTASADLQIAYLKLVSGRSTDALDQARAARADLKRQQDALVAAQSKADASVRAIATARDDLAKTEGALQATLSQVKGHLAELVAAQQAANEAAAASAARARVAAAAAAPRRSPGPAQNLASVSVPASGPGAQAALAFARAQLGKPYVYGAAGPGSYDCSGLTMRSWQAGGVSLPHNASAQYNSVHHIPFGSLQPGDLVFESGLGHVGIYIGGGQMIHAPHSGDVVRISALWSSMDLAGRP